MMSAPLGFVRVVKLAEIRRTVDMRRLLHFSWSHAAFSGR
jgi:hypothetical protein